MENYNAFNSEMDTLIKDLKKTSTYLESKLSDTLKKSQVYKEKKGLVNKKRATMILSVDNSVMIIFDDPADGEKFFEGIKSNTK